jgi:predicted ATPase
VLLLEDLHWADKPTALLLAHVVRSIEDERVLSSARTAIPSSASRWLRARGPAPRAGARAAAAGSLHRGEVATMISAGSGATPPTHFAHALHRETEGNPFFIEEVLRHLIEVGAATGPSGSAWLVHGARHPDGVREAIERRLGRLSPRRARS